MGAAIAAALIGVAGTAYGAYSQQQAAKDAAAGSQSALQGGEFGEVPQAALYEPINFNEEQRYAIGANLDAMNRIKQLVNVTNPFITKDALRRVRDLVPAFTQSMRQMGSNTTSLLSGQLPFDDVADIVSDRASLGGGIGTPGTAGPATMKDLGLSRLDAMKTGAGMLGEMVNMAETISPRGSYINPREMFVSPLDRIRLEMEQRQLEQQSTQNYYNLEASANPNEAAALQMRLGLAQTGGGGGNDIAGYASAAQQLIGAVGQWGQRQPAAAVPTVVSTPNNQPYSYNADLGWTPVAQPVSSSSWA